MLRDTLTAEELQLLSAVVANFVNANLNPKSVKYYLKHKDRIPEALRRSFNKLLPPKTWGKLKLGTGRKSVYDFGSALQNCHIHDDAHNIMRRCESQIALMEREVELVAVSIDELDTEENASIVCIYAKAKELGLEPCPAEAAPQLCLQHAGELALESFIIPVQPLKVETYHKFYLLRIEQQEPAVRGITLAIHGHDVGGSHKSPAWFADGKRWLFMRCK